MAFFSDFKKFLMRGDIIALATAVVVGGAFNKITASLVADVLMPIVGLFTSGDALSQQFIALDGEYYPSLDAAREAEAAIITYGNFLGSIINFIIIGFIIFLFLRAYEKTKKKQEEAAPAPKGPTTEQLLAEIRDELKKQNKA